MIKIDENNAIVYNANKEIVMLQSYDKNAEEWSMVPYKNEENISNEQIVKNIGTRLKLKDRIEAAYRRSIFCRTFNEDIVFAGRIWRSTVFDTDNNSFHKKLLSKIESMSSCGVITDYGIYWKLSYFTEEEINKICEYLENLSNKLNKSASQTNNTEI